MQPPQALQQSGTLPFEGYAYDTVGNRIGSSQQSGTWQYNQDNQLTQQGEGKEKTSYTYTANGNIASEAQGETSKTYTYDASDRLIRITSIANGSETEVARYAYDPMGRRIAKTIEGQTTYFLYTDEGLIAELNQQGNITKAYGWVADTSYSTSPLWQAEPQAGETTISDLKQAQFHTLTTDHLGTVQMATNEAGEVTWKAQSQAFGQTTPDEQNQITMNLRFPGQYFDEETGTHYNYFRDYNPSIGRYIQRDPIGLEGEVNVYLYAKSNILKYFDNRGRSSSGVVKIVECIIQCIRIMSENGMRYHRSINNTLRLVDSKVLDCGEQTDFVIDNCLKSLQLDDDWMFYPRGGIGHTWGIAQSSNPSDQKIWFDPRAGQISFDKPCDACSGLLGKWGDDIANMPTEPIKNHVNK